MLRNLLLTVLVLAVAAACTSSSPDQQASPSLPPGANSQLDIATVEITSGGFVPETVTVSNGASVTWVNKDSVQHWPASDPHPVHTDYAGFDATLPLNANERFSFTFLRTGTWTYHDHLNPDVKGTVVVTE